MADAKTYLVERYIPHLKDADVKTIASRLATATQAMQAEGRTVEWIGSIALRDDETCLCLFTAATSGDVEEANRLARADYERILEARMIEPTAVRGRFLKGQ